MQLILNTGNNLQTLYSINNLKRRIESDSDILQSIESRAYQRFEDSCSAEPKIRQHGWNEQAACPLMSKRRRARRKRRSAVATNKARGKVKNKTLHKQPISSSWSIDLDKRVNCCELEFELSRSNHIVGNHIVIWDFERYGCN